LREIVARQGIPQPFLVQILQTLRGAGFVGSTRGSNGGYRLLVDPERITVADIADALGGETTGVATGGSSGGMGSESRDSAEQTAMMRVWREADEAAQEVLRRTRLSDLVQSVEGVAAEMFYI
jgi:Rrf2 family protein